MAKVAIVEFDKEIETSFTEALQLIGGIEELNTSTRNVVIKVGVFNPKASQHTTVDVVREIIKRFSKAPTVYLAESDNYRGTGDDRLQIWKELFTERVTPFNLSADEHTKLVTIADEPIELSHILFKPNILVSTHALRVYKWGTIMKNLLGLAPGKKKARFHKKMAQTLLDLYEAVEGIDLAVIDATFTFPGPSARKGVPTKVLIAGRDAVAVDAVGAALLGMDPKKMPIIEEAQRRGVGEGDLKQIQILGSPLESVQERVTQQLKTVKN